MLFFQLTENSLKEDGRPERSANGIGDEAEIKVNKVFEQGEQLKSVSMDSAFVNVVGSVSLGLLMKEYLNCIYYRMMSR